MAQNVLVCDVDWVGTTCPGVLSQQDIEPLVASTAPFDWSALDQTELWSLFAGTAGFVIGIWALAHGAGIALDVLRKS